jgi:hypothetical protein
MAAVRRYGDAQGVTNCSRIQPKAGPELLQFSIRFTAPYRRSGKQWLVMTWQASRLPEN